MISRRHLIQGGLASAAALLMPPGPVRRRALSTFTYLCDVAPVAATSPAVAAVVPFQSALRIPPVAVPVRSDATTDHYEITMREGQAEILPGKLTPVWGYDGLYPGPTVRARVGREVSVVQRNALAEPMSVHLHGGNVPADMDGLPQDVIPPGAYKDYRYPNAQRPATLWYHDHVMHVTHQHVYRGLSGFYILADDVEERLGLPSGERDVPLLIQDRKIAEDGSLIYDGNHHGFFGNIIVVNGVAHPYFHVAAAPYRFRVVNGSNARHFDLALDSGEALTVIGTDGGLLPAPVKVSSVPLSPAERVELLVDFGNRAPGTSVVLRNRLASADAPGVMRFDVVAAGPPSPTAALPATLRPVEPLPPPSAVREVSLSFDEAKGIWVLNGAGFHPERIDWRPRLGSTEVWRLVNQSNDIHPIHLHLVMFQVLRRNGVEPPAFERGWKDTVVVRARETVEIAARFGDFTGTFPYHCHILEHEDHDMMSQFRVVDLARVAGSGRVETAAAVSERTYTPGVAVAFLAAADSFADAGAVGPAAAKAGGPVLLTTGAALAEATRAELRRLQPGRIVVLGGRAVIPESVEGELAGYTTGGVERVAGESRYDTAAEVARAFFARGVPVAYVATGQNFADALGAGAAAAAAGGPVLLVTGGELPPATAQALRHLDPRRIVVVGGPAAVSEAVVAELAPLTSGSVDRVAGDDRYGTAAAVSRSAFAAPAGAVFVATGKTFPDALAAVPAAAAAGAPLLLVDGDGVPPATVEEIRRLAPSRMVVVGGPAAVSAEVEETLASLL